MAKERPVVLITGGGRGIGRGSSAACGAARLTMSP